MPVIKKTNVQLLEKISYIEAALSESVLTEALITEICTYVRDGVPKKTVAKAVGVSYATLTRWMRIGTGKEVAKDVDMTLCKLLAQKIEQSEALAQIDLIRMMKKAAEGGIVLSERELKGKEGAVIERTYSAQAGAWYLERRNTEDWGRKFYEPSKETEEEAVDANIFHLLNEQAKEIQESDKNVQDYLN
jgi:hypothetical protein